MAEKKKPKPKNPHAEALGKLGGKARTEAKAQAARANGKRGGRPKRPNNSAEPTAKPNDKQS